MMRGLEEILAKNDMSGNPTNQELATGLAEALRRS
jgi:hypothetical protein